MCDLMGLSGLYEPIDEAIGLAFDRAIEHLDRVRILLVRGHGAFRVQYETGRLDLRASGVGLDPMQRPGIARIQQKPPTNRFIPRLVFSQLRVRTSTELPPRLSGDHCALG